MSECREYQGPRHPDGYGFPSIGEQRSNYREGRNLRSPA